MFDRAAAEDALHRISKRHVSQFLNGPDGCDTYGFGFFCDAYDGTVCLVANTQQYHLTSLRNFGAQFGPVDRDLFRWDIGNWKYPAGLFSSSSAEQREFYETWKECQVALSQIENDDNQERLEDICFKVLRRLIHEGAFSMAPTGGGVMILGPTALRQNVLERKKRLDRLLDPAGGRV